MVAAILMFVLAGCTRSNYVDSVPANSKAVVSVNAMELIDDDSPVKTVLLPFVNKDKKSLKGIDLTKDMYAFETIDGLFGLSIFVNDRDALLDFFQRLQTIGVLSELEEGDDEIFAVAFEKWIAGYNEKRLLVMGPVVNSVTERENMKDRMRSMMNQKADEGLRNSDMWKYLDSVNAPMKMVAEASALPNELVSAFMIGAPRGTDPSDVMLRAEVEYEDSILMMKGDMFSYNPNIDQALKQAAEVYRPMTVNWEKLFADTLLAGVFMNVDGEEFVELLNRDKTLGSMLIGTHRYDRIKGNKGDMAFLFSGKMSESIDTAGIQTHIINLPKGTEKDGERLVIAINVKKATSAVAGTFLSWVNRVKNIVFTLKKPETKDEKAKEEEKEDNGEDKKD